METRKKNERETYNGGYSQAKTNLGASWGMVGGGVACKI